MKKIIVLNPTNDAREVSKQPFGLLTIASKFMDNGFDVVWLDGDPNRGEDLDNECRIMLKDPMPFYLRRLLRKLMVKIVLPAFAPFFIKKLVFKRGSMKIYNSKLAGAVSDDIHIELQE